MTNVQDIEVVTLVLTKRSAELLALLVLDSNLPVTVPLTEASSVGEAAGELVAAVTELRG
jgi:hypothetical protein